ncbi:MAG: hypothetical protein SFV81_07210 [Pirellulaceae bacterium]|nr:hypothetical protein [Pirellulaceae bacterium]
MKKNYLQKFSVAALLLTSGVSLAQEAATEAAPAQPRTVTRLFWQDSDSNSVRWSNLQKGTDWTIKATDISAFPKLDKEQCSLVQMEEAEGVLLTGVHDQEDGTVQSGWIAIDSGVEQEAHGDHFHWKFAAEPKVKTTKLDKTQGNPAHVYLYDNQFYLANDKKDGFTVVDPKALVAGKPADRFFSGGGGHITMAAVNNQVCYSTWIDREGDKMGRVDVVPLTSGAGKGYSFQLPSGGIHGATANSGKVFFAPSDGVCWVDADVNLTKSAAKVTANHLSLGKDATDKPLRTGAFTNHLNWVLFVTGTGEAVQLCMIDAKSAKPSVIKFPLNLPAGTTATTPTAVKTATGKHYVFIFQESKDGQQTEKLLAIELDANSDGNLSDAVVAKTIEVGASKIEGHGGHHEIAITPSRRFAMLTNPGNGSIWVVGLKDLDVQAKLNVGGTPTRVVAVGG